MRWLPWNNDYDEGGLLVLNASGGHKSFDLGGSQRLEQCDDVHHFSKLSQQ